MVLAGRYIYTLMARELCAGWMRAWLRTYNGMRGGADAVFY